MFWCFKNHVYLCVSPTIMELSVDEAGFKIKEILALGFKILGLKMCASTTMRRYVLN